LPEKPREDVTREINTLINDGLRLTDVDINGTERKTVISDSKPGVIIVKCATQGGKQNIMKSKTKLRGSWRYDRVYIEHDVTKQQRLLNAHLRTLVNVIGKDRVQLKGSPIAMVNEDQSRGGHFNRKRDNITTRDQLTERRDNINRGWNNTAESRRNSDHTRRDEYEWRTAGRDGKPRRHDNRG
jgi:hypothetical protein